jgi:hypothetical protein
MIKKVVPSLGFPEEMWDEDGDYLCRPRPDLIACVVGLLWGGRLDVSFVRWHAEDSAFWRCRAEGRKEDDPRPYSLEELWGCQPDMAGFETDCPLQAQAVIQHFIDTHPPAQEEADG